MIRAAVHLAPALGLAALLAACTSEGSARPEASPPPVAESTPPANPTSCGAEKLSEFIGTQPSPDNVARMKALSGAQTTRVVAPGDMVTQDFRADRLTIYTGADGRIARFGCV